MILRTLDRRLQVYQCFYRMTQQPMQDSQKTITLIPTQGQLSEETIREIDVKNSHWVEKNLKKLILEEE